MDRKTDRMRERQRETELTISISKSIENWFPIGNVETG